jgi:hypothetical protein
MKRRGPTRAAAPGAAKKPKKQTPQVTKVEVWNKGRLRLLISLVDIPGETRTVLSKIDDKLVGGDKLEVAYAPSKEAGFGRLYGFGLQGLPSWIRRVVRPHDHDIDIKNCAPSFWVQVAERELGPGAAPHMRHYVDNRDEVLANELGDLPRDRGRRRC